MKKIDFIIAKNKFGTYCVPNSSAYTYTSKKILNGGIHEPSTIKFIQNNHKNKDIIHAGACFGVFFPALKEIPGKVWSFEPNEENFFCAQKTIELNKIENVNLFNCGLGKESFDGFIKIKENGIYLGPRSYTEETPSKDSLPIKIVALDDIIPQEKEISIIHLDVEGYEFQILEGAKKIIEKNSPLIILEIDEKPVKYNEFMANIGYYPFKQLIYNAKDMVFVNTVYKKGKKNGK